MKCKHCTTGRIIPKFRRLKKPIYRCSNCKRRYTPRAERG